MSIEARQHAKRLLACLEVSPAQRQADAQRKAAGQPPREDDTYEELRKALKAFLHKQDYTPGRQAAKKAANTPKRRPADQEIDEQPLPSGQIPETA